MIKTTYLFTFISCKARLYLPNCVSGWSLGRETNGYDNITYVLVYSSVENSSVSCEDHTVFYKAEEKIIP